MQGVNLAWFALLLLNLVAKEAIKRRFTEFIMLNEDDNLDQFLVIDE